MQIIQNYESEAHKRSSHTARARKRAEVRTQPLEFVCVDGEGVTLPDGTHRYVLIGLGQNQISDPNGLSWERIFAFLYDNFQTGSVAYTGFFLGYDFTQWLATLPEYQARRLLDSTERAKRKRRIGHNNQPLEGEIYFPVDLDGWEFDILGMKRLKLRPQGASRWMYICDTGGFFQKSFLSVINPDEWREPVVSTDEYETIKKGKEERATATLSQDMRHYNRLENEALSRVLRKLDEGFRELGINLSPKQWFGPGQAAQAWLEGRAPTGKEVRATVPADFLEAAIASYYGGWFEIMAHGIIPGITHEYDINSAYPYIISRLPCLIHGTYTSGYGPIQDPRDSSLFLVYATAWSQGCRKSQEIRNGTHYFIGSMLHRDEDGSIFRPLKTEGWYWLHELEAAHRAGTVAGYNITVWHAYQPCDCPPPLAEVAGIYDLRQKVGKKTPLGIACKMVPNSLYGKFAQSVGNPKYGNPIYASLITAGCRTMILDSIATHPGGKKDTLMVATDGVYFRTPHPGLAITGKLGDWDHGEKSDLLLFKPGVYWDDKTRQDIREGKSPVFKTRGVSARDFAAHIDAIDDMFAGLLGSHSLPTTWPEVEFTLSFSMVTAVQALQRNRWDLAGTISNDRPVKQSSNPVLKRARWYWDGDILRSQPPQNIPYEASHKYSKRFGLDDPWSEESLSQYGETPDGKAGELWKEILFP